jgi:L-glyceraldehyde 3-phosphate reductase
MEPARQIIFRAFDLGITHFDLANNYGPPPGSAEENFGKILSCDLSAYRDELVISTKAGYLMWPGPYGEWGSRKYLLASLEQSLKRMRLDYVDIFYSHRVDPETPLEETLGALDTAVRQGKALYVGISSYSAAKTREALAILRSLGTPCLIHQPSYSMLNRWIEKGLLDVLGEEGIGCIAFSPLAQGMLSDKYLAGVPAGTRAATPGTALDRKLLTEENLRHIRALNANREGTRPEPCPDGARVGPAGLAGDHRFDRGERPRSAHGKRRCALEPAIHGRGACPHRQGCRGGRHKPLVPVK